MEAQSTQGPRHALNGQARTHVALTLGTAWLQGLTSPADCYCQIIPPNWDGLEPCPHSHAAPRFACWASSAHKTCRLS
jgi:hypothetical protein